MLEMNLFQPYAVVNSDLEKLYEPLHQHDYVLYLFTNRRVRGVAGLF